MDLAWMQAPLDDFHLWLPCSQRTSGGRCAKRPYAERYASTLVRSAFAGSDWCALMCVVLWGAKLLLEGIGLMHVLRL